MSSIARQKAGRERTQRWRSCSISSCMWRRLMRPVSSSRVASSWMRASAYAMSWLLPARTVAHAAQPRGQHRDARHHGGDQQEVAPLRRAGAYTAGLRKAITAIVMANTATAKKLDAQHGARCERVHAEHQDHHQHREGTAPRRGPQAHTPLRRRGSRTPSAARSAKARRSAGSARCGWSRRTPRSRPPAPASTTRWHQGASPTHTR